MISSKNIMNKLSIITVNLNNKIGLQKTIDSIVNQNFSDFEFIIVDGKSNDGSIEIIKQYNHKLTKWISELDSGIYQAMNKGIRIATGEYLLFLNSGDCLVDKNVLTKIFSTYFTADIVCGKCNIWDNGNIVHTTNPPEFHTFASHFNTSINHQSTFIKRNLFERFGYYREDFKINSDWEFSDRTIILNNCTTQRLDIIITQYNLDGMSSNCINKELAQKEIDEVLTHPILARFVPDYKNWFEEKKKMKMFYWVKSKKILYLPLLLNF